MPLLPRTSTLVTHLLRRRPPRRKMWRVKAGGGFGAVPGQTPRKKVSNQPFPSRNRQHSLLLLHICWTTDNCLSSRSRATEWKRDYYSKVNCIVPPRGFCLAENIPSPSSWVPLLFFLLLHKRREKYRRCGDRGHAFLAISRKIIAVREYRVA